MSWTFKTALTINQQTESNKFEVNLHYQYATMKYINQKTI